MPFTNHKRYDVPLLAALGRLGSVPHRCPSRSVSTRTVRVARLCLTYSLARGTRPEAAGHFQRGSAKNCETTVSPFSGYHLSWIAFPNNPSVRMYARFKRSPKTLQTNVCLGSCVIPL